MPQNIKKDSMLKLGRKKIKENQKNIKKDSMLKLGNKTKKRKTSEDGETSIPKD